MTPSEIVSLIASVVVFLSYLFKDQCKLRMANLLASLLFITYALLLLIETQWRSGYSILILNIGTTLIHFFYLAFRKKNKQDSDSAKKGDDTQ